MSERGRPRGPEPAGGTVQGFSTTLERRLPAGTDAWAVMQPNAVGRGELRSFVGFTQRQVLKSRELCPADRVFIAVGSTEVVMWQALPGRFVGRQIGRWQREQLVAERVEPIGTPDLWWPAMRLSVRRAAPSGSVRRAPIAELRAVRDEPRARLVTELLTGHRDRA